MKYSVIIPCYNASNTVVAALDSLVEQRREDFEVILIDDASEDVEVTADAVARYADKLDVRLIRNERNMNGAYSRNVGIQAARGQYVAFLDADDTWSPDRLRLADETLTKQKDHDKPFIIYGRFELLREHKSGVLLPLRGIRSHELVADYVFAAGQHMQTSTFVCPTAVARRVMFDDRLTRHQDSDFMMRAQAAGIDFYFQKDKCANYRFRAGDLQRRIQSGRINTAFCNDWLSSKRDFLSGRARSGYALTVTSRIVHIEYGFLPFIVIIGRSAAGIGVRNMLDLLQTKIMVILKTRMGF